MATVEVFDPPMCCSTGVCGPSVDPALARFAGDLTWLADQGASVARHNLSQEPQAFAESGLIRELLTERGDEALPAVVVDGELRSSGRFPTRTELADWSLAQASADTLDTATLELVAIGAAVGANCEPSFESHYNEARRLGIGLSAITEAVRVAQTVKDAPARSMLELAAKLLDTDVVSLGWHDLIEAAQGTDDAGGSCCGGATTPVAVNVGAEAIAASSGCCGGSESDAEAPSGETSSSCCG